MADAAVVAPLTSAVPSRLPLRAGAMVRCRSSQERRMTKIRSTILALALVAAAGSVAQAQNAPTDRARVERAQRSDSAKKQMRGARQMRGKHPQGINVALRGIQLTDAQRTQVTAIQKKYQDQFKAMRDSAK